MLLVAALASAASALPARAQQAAEEPVRPTAGPALDLRPGDAREAFLSSQLSFSRVSFARAQKEQTLRDRFATLGLPFPPAGLYLRVFKVERIVEVWVLPRGGERYAHLVSYPVCAVSGWLGPKRGQGDLQIPEGFYEVESFNPMSEYHLSLRLNYPNEADRRAQPDMGSLGGDIYVHGGCQTIGCVPITDEHIRELYWLAVQARAGGARRIPVHVFPARLDDAGLEWLGGFFGDDPGLMEFWGRMQEGYAFFERERRVPGIGVDGAGRYVVGEPSEVRGYALLGTPTAAEPRVGERAEAPVEAVPGLLGEPAEVAGPEPARARGDSATSEAAPAAVVDSAASVEVPAAVVDAQASVDSPAADVREPRTRGIGRGQRGSGAEVLLGVAVPDSTPTPPDAPAEPASDAAPESAASTLPTERPEEARATAPVDPIPGLLGDPLPTPPAAQASP
ncbi:MAG TPA: L,D-transpeptidase family protein, partial [Longimicrobiales bacterium]|nr:L,D-transpeptidase family protein [Longimicrobiales bacterium]